MDSRRKRLLRRRVLMRCVAVAAAVIVALALAELSVRLFVNEAYWAFRDPSSYWRVDPTLGWVQREHLDIEEFRGDGALVQFQTNEDGLLPADARPARPPGTRRVLFVGDSTVVGRSVPESARIHRQLQELLSERGITTDVVNAGVEGYSTDQALLRLVTLLPRYRPDLVLHAFCLNDLEGNRAGTQHGLAKPRFSPTADGGLQLERFAPNTSLPRVTGFRRRMQDLALYRLIQPLAQDARFESEDAIGRALAGMSSELHWRPELMARLNWSLLELLFRRMRAVCDSAGALLIIYAHPDISATWEPAIDAAGKAYNVPPNRYDRHAIERRVEACALAAGARFVPLVSTFQHSQPRGPFHLLPRDPHCNESGYRVTAEALVAALLRALPLGGW